MHQPRLLRTLATTALLAGFAPAADRPNILFILAAKLDAWEKMVAPLPKR